MAKLIDSLAFGESSYVLSIPYAVCTTGASTAAKTVTASNWVETANLEAGARIVVKFNNSNTASSPTLNVNSTGAKSIVVNSGTITSTQYWSTGAVVEFVYDGTYWCVVGTVNDNDTKYALRVGTANTTTNDETTTNGDVFIKLIRNGNFVQDGFRIKGFGGTTVTSDDEGYIEITSDVSTTVVNNTTTSKYYLTGSTTSSNTTGNLVKRSTVYVDTSSNIVANNIPATGLIWQSF